MRLEFTCPACGAVVGANVEGETDLACKACGNVFAVSASSVREAVDRKLLDPADPGGFFANFPPEDDNL